MPSSHHLTLVHSPLVGPGTWELLATSARRRGHDVVVPDLAPSIADGPPFASRQVAAVAGSVGQHRTVLVGHSRAGPLLAAMGDAVGGVEGHVFVDAALPTPGKSWFETVPSELGAQRQSMARDGTLPPWPQWWGPGDLERLLPDAEVRQRFAAECPPLPLAMFEEALPPSPGWVDRPSAYLRLSDAYQQPADQARALGWPVIELAGHHLWILTQPELVLESLLDLVDHLRA
jgi:hypothetical protein